MRMSSAVRWQAPGLWPRAAILLLLLASAAALATAPLLMPEGYSWTRHTVSESAAQGLGGACLARLGFLLFGLAALWLSQAAATRWGRWGSLFLTAFGVLMVAAAVFSNRPWLSETPFDETEDLLHSLTATGMGFAFAFGVVAVAFQPERSIRRRLFDATAVACSVAIPLSMTWADDLAGLLQRGMFLVAYTWFTIEAAFPDFQRSEEAAPDALDASPRT
jgi:hypothetical protein